MTDQTMPPEPEDAPEPAFVAEHLERIGAALQDGDHAEVTRILEHLRDEGGPVVRTAVLRFLEQNRPD